MTDRVKITNHEPVMVREVLEGLKIAHLNESRQKVLDKKFIDATLGFGGHSVEIVKRGGKVLGIDADWEAIKLAGEKLRLACPTPQETERYYQLIHGNFRNIDEIAIASGYTNVDGILYDLGVSSPQLTSTTRGFSFTNPDAALDMRIDTASQAVTGADMLNLLDKRKLEKVFGNVMTSSSSRKLAGIIVKRRQTAKFEKVGDFLQTVKKVFKFDGSIHPATLPFMALRMAVNSELENLADSLVKAFGLLVKGGRMVVISFHSGEDAIVKNFYISMRENGEKIITKKPLRPSEEEVALNPRSRSAKLRIIEKV